MALPTYTMSCFLLPKKLCKQIAGVMADFWWKNSKENMGIHWKAWEKLCHPKEVGGLGFKDIESFNVALLGKQLWRMITCKDTLMARVFNIRYFQKSDPLMTVRLGSRPSQPARPVRMIRRIQPDLINQMYVLHKVKDLMLPGRKKRMEQRTPSDCFWRGRGKEDRGIRPGGDQAKDSYCWDFTKTENEESINHMLFQCHFARLVWALSAVPAPVNRDMSDLIYTNLHEVMTVAQQHPGEEEAEKLGPWIIWRLWKDRNDLIIKGTEYDPMAIVMKAKEDMEE
ncbi:unnamed protein product [Microthlaspi erraticum]|uniref:Reverse transcriptase zinc-binding domain-containing protein n=1 Tax=Microthlaspi erraticum TaxID=1685480 RepID=A0A6D2K055_9BRAS|nr:unnamed protein product [Microthlaspi erraticum]